MSNWAEPYRVVTRSFFNYDVVYDGELVLISSNDHHNAERIAAMLNGAYNLGYSTAKIEQELGDGNAAA